MDLRKTKMSLNEALRLAKPHDKIYLEDKTYVEKIRIDIPYLTLIGQKNTVISYSCSHGTILPASEGGDGVKTYGTTGSATVLVCSQAVGFQAENITFENAYERKEKPHGQAVAFKSECSHMVLKNCRFLGHQDTLYIDDGVENLVIDCFIQGDIDFVFGSADCKFINCTLKALKNDKKIAYFLAPDTYIDHVYGFYFENCQFQIESSDMEVYLGRRWFPSGAKREVYPKVFLKQCSLDHRMIVKLIQMHEEDPLIGDLVVEELKFV